MREDLTEIGKIKSFRALKMPDLNLKCVMFAHTAFSSFLKYIFL